MAGGGRTAVGAGRREGVTVLRCRYGPAMPGWASPWLWTADTWAGLQFGVLVVALVVAWLQAREAIRLREDSTRPFVSIDFTMDRRVIHLATQCYAECACTSAHWRTPDVFRTPINHHTRSTSGSPSGTPDLDVLPEPACRQVC